VNWLEVWFVAKKLKIAFIQHLNTELLGSMYVSAVLKESGHETQLFLESQEENFMKSIIAWDPDVVATQTRTGQHMWALKVCKELKEVLDTKVVFGGPHSTYMPHIVEHPAVDIVVRGEGEYVMRDVCNALASNDDYTSIPGTFVKNERGEIHENPIGEMIHDLTNLPFPDRDLPYKYKFLRSRGNKAFIGGRGCMYPCTFCHNHLAMRLYDGQGRWARKMEPERFIEEMVYVRDNYPPLRVLNLERDDDILHIPEWAQEVFTLFPERVGLPHYIMTRPDCVTDDIIRILKESNCIGVSISLETANETLRNEVLQKRYNKEEFVNAMDILHRHKMPVKVFNTVGIPGETLEDALDTLRLNIKVKPTWARCSILQPYPPTDLYQMCVDKKLFREDFDPDNFDFFYFKNSMLNFPGIDHLVNIQKFFSITVRFPFLLPLVKILVKFKPNALFDKIGMIIYGIFGARFEHLSLKEFIEFSRASAAFLTKKGNQSGLDNKKRQKAFASAPEVATAESHSQNERSQDRQRDHEH
jgi:radical SAM superfamily enzyme YgiQ (UPF0313 family)